MVLANIIQAILSGQSELSLESTLRKDLGICYSASSKFFSRGGLHWYLLSTRVPKGKSTDALKGFKSIVRRLFTSELDSACIRKSIIASRAANRRKCMGQLDAVDVLELLWKHYPHTEHPDSIYDRMLNSSPKDIQLFAQATFAARPGFSLAGGIDQGFMERVYSELFTEE